MLSLFALNTRKPRASRGTEDHSRVILLHFNALEHFNNKRRRKKLVKIGQIGQILVATLADLRELFDKKLFFV